MTIATGAHSFPHNASIESSKIELAKASVVEEWGSDDDFDLSSMNENALQLPRSEHGSDGYNSREDDIAIQEGSVLVRGDEEEDWAAEFADDEDQGDTIKVSSIADSTLAQLASLRKNKKVDDNDLNHLSLEHMQGTVTRLGSYGSIARRVDMAGGSDWDEDLEVPDNFPILRPLHEGSGFASELEFEMPSIDSTSDTNTSGSLPSDSHQRNLTRFSSPSSQKDQLSSTSSVASSFDSISGRTKFSSTKSSGAYSKASKNQESERKGEEEDDFDFPEGMVNLTLSSSISRQRSHPTLEQQKILWGEDGKRSSSPGYVSRSEASTKESDAEEDGMLEGIDFPDQLFANTKAEAPNAAVQLKARLDARKKSIFKDSEGTSSGKGWIGGSRENDFSEGLIITDDLDLSPSRLRSKKLSNRIREAAHQRKRSQDFKGLSTQRSVAIGVEKNSATPAAQSSLRLPISTTQIPSSSSSSSRITVSSPSPAQVGESQKSRVEQDRFKTKTISPSTLLASTAASRARANSPNPFLPPRQNSLLDNVQSSSRISNDDLVSKSGSSHVRGSATRYSMPTAASRAKQTDAVRTSMSSPVNSPMAIQMLKGPKRPREYGDGRELDSIDDLPVNRERQETRKTRDSTFVKKDANQSRGGGANKASSSSTVPPQSLRGKGRQSKKRQPMLIRNLGGSNTAPRVEGDMKWNPRLQRWEGNEEEGRSFENAVKGSGRPALIAQLSVTSTNVVLGPGSRGVVRIVQSDPISPPPVGARVVGDMIFDPIRLRWINKNEEEEEDVFAGIKDDDDDASDEEEREAKKKKPSSMMVMSGMQTRRDVASHSLASFPGQRSGTPKMMATATGSEWTADAISQLLRRSGKQVMPESLANKLPANLWQECIEAKARHEEEMTAFVPRRGVTATSSSPFPTPLLRNKRRMNQTTAARDRNSHLYMIQALARKAMPD